MFIRKFAAMFSDETFMQRCIDLARMGIGFVAPNPMVGCVIVYENKIIGEGYHKRFGEEHAEVNAINNVSQPELLEKATLYVCLEPCAHHGKTPPCADLIIQKRIPRVVIGCSDTFEAVNGKGIERLRNAGIEVKLGVLEAECLLLNKRFFTFHQKKRPYIILKWAQTQDGFIDKIRKAGEEKKINWISCQESKSLVHQWRSEEQAILVGKNTVLTDNPTLTVREVLGKNPVRIVLDPQMELPSDCAVFNVQSTTIILNALEDEQVYNLHYFQVNPFDTQNITNCLFELEIQSVLVEGGAFTIQKFIDCGLWDEARILVGSKRFGDGLKAPVIPKLPQHIQTHFTDQIHYIYRS